MNRIPLAPSLVQSLCQHHPSCLNHLVIVMGIKRSSIHFSFGEHPDPYAPYKTIKAAT